MNASRGLVALWTLHTGSLAGHTNDELSGRGMNGCNGDFSWQVEHILAQHLGYVFGHSLVAKKRAFIVRQSIGQGWYTFLGMTPTTRGGARQIENEEEYYAHLQR